MGLYLCGWHRVLGGLMRFDMRAGYIRIGFYEVAKIK